MKLYEPLPDSVEWDGKRIDLCLTFDRVLDALDMVSDLRFDEMERIRYCLDTLCAGKHPDDPDLLSAIFKLLFTEQKSKKKEKALDFEQDRALIVAAFRQAYGIDLNAERGRMHWQTFSDLLKGIPADTRLAEVMSIRMRPMPKPTKYNSEERANLARLKAEFRLEKTETEIHDNVQAGLQSMAALLISRAESKDK